MLYGPLIKLLAKLLIRLLTVLGIYIKGRSDERAKAHMAAMELARRAWKFKAEVDPSNPVTGFRVLGDDPNPLQNFTPDSAPHPDPRTMPTQK